MSSQTTTTHPTKPTPQRKPARERQQENNIHHQPHPRKPTTPPPPHKPYKTHPNTGVSKTPHTTNQQQRAAPNNPKTTRRHTPPRHNKPHRVTHADHVRYLPHPPNRAAHMLNHIVETIKCSIATSPVTMNPGAVRRFSPTAPGFIVDQYQHMDPCNAPACDLTPISNALRRLAVAIPATVVKSRRARVSRVR